MKPGGRLLITDYCCSDETHSEQFKTYVAQRGYHLLSPVQYGEVGIYLLRHHCCIWNAVARRSNARLAIERAWVRIPSATVSKFGYFRSLHDALVQLAV